MCSLPAWVAFGLLIHGSMVLGMGVMLLAASLDPTAPLLELGLLSGAMVVFGALFAAPYVATGVGLARRMAWARALAVAMTVTLVGSIPIGLSLGIYTISVLTDDEVRAEFV